MTQVVLMREVVDLLELRAGHRAVALMAEEIAAAVVVVLAVEVLMGHQLVEIAAVIVQLAGTLEIQRLEIVTAAMPVLVAAAVIMAQPHMLSK